MAWPICQSLRCWSRAASACSQQWWSHSLCRRQSEETGKGRLPGVQLKDASQGLTLSLSSVRSGPKAQPPLTAEHTLPPLLQGWQPCPGQGMVHRNRALYFNRPFICSPQDHPAGLIRGPKLPKYCFVAGQSTEERDLVICPRLYCGGAKTPLLGDRDTPASACHRPFAC